MHAHWKYVKYLIRHKWFVFRAGLRVGAPLWRLIIHDWTKFLPSEWGPYTFQFYSTRDVQGAFDLAWLHHQRRNKHHWQYWVLIPDQPTDAWRNESMDGGMTDARLRLYGKNDPHEDGPKHEVVIDFRERPGTPAVDKAKEASVRWQPYPTDEAMRDVDLLHEHAVRGLQLKPLPMPEPYIREMIADWAGAGRAITGEWAVRTWYEKNKHHIHLHPDTRRLTEALLDFHF